MKPIKNLLLAVFILSCGLIQANEAEHLQQEIETAKARLLPIRTLTSEIIQNGITPQQALEWDLNALSKYPQITDLQIKMQELGKQMETINPSTSDNKDISSLKLILECMLCALEYAEIIIKSAPEDIPEPYKTKLKQALEALRAA